MRGLLVLLHVAGVVVHFELLTHTKKNGFGREYGKYKLTVAAQPALRSHILCETKKKGETY